jgi:hypothetical protein
MLRPEDARRTLRRAAFLTSGAGIGYGVLAVMGWYLLNEDRRGFAAAEDPMAYYERGGLDGAVIAGLYLLPFAAILFLWFIVALRGWIRGTRKRRNMLISDLQLMSGAVFTAIFLVGVGAIATPLVVMDSGIGSISLEDALLVAGFGNSLMDVMGVRIAAIFVLATASLGVTTSVLPRWFSLTSYAFGALLMLAPMVDPPLILAFPAWVIVLSLILLFHVLNLPDDQLPGFAMRSLDPEGARPAQDVAD